MVAVMSSLHAQLAQLRTKLDDIPALQKLEDRCNVPKEIISIVGAFFALAIIFFGLSTGTICDVVGFLYPAIQSLRAIERKSHGNEVTQWLIYWVVYSLFSIIEVFITSLLYWIPFYYSFKLAFLLWAMLPQTRGAKFLYDSFLKDFLLVTESKIDKAMNTAKTRQQQQVGGGGGGGGEKKEE